MGAILNLAVWLCRACIPIEVTWPWENTRGHAMAMATCPRALRWPWLVACWSVIFQNVGFFQKKNVYFLKCGYLVKLAYLSLDRVPTGAALAFTTCL